MKTSKLIFLCFCIAGMFMAAPVTYADSAASAASVSSITNKSGSHSELAFTGVNGTHVINGEKAEVKGGTLRINGVSYGKVSAKSAIKYTVKGKRKTVTVDGAVRKPVRR